MDVPILALLYSIKEFRVLHFKDINHANNAPPHFYIVFPAKDGPGVIMCIITSQITKRIEYYKRTATKAIKSIVPVNKNVLPFLSKKSIIDCNQAEFFTTREELARRIDPAVSCEMKNHPIPANLIQAIQSAVLQSPIISTTIKGLI